MASNENKLELAITYHIQNNMKDAIHLYEELSNQNNAVAKYNLALCYRYGNGVPINVNKYIALCKESSDLGCLDATYELAVQYDAGIKIECNTYKAIKLYWKSSESSDIFIKYYSKYNIARHYAKQRSEHYDMKRAIILFMEVNDVVEEFEQDHIVKGISKLILAICYEHGNCVDCNIKYAIQLYEQSHQLGNKIATRRLAGCYENGIGVTCDMKKARDLYKQAE
jgi:uncharacterized protein